MKKRFFATVLALSMMTGIITGCSSPSTSKTEEAKKGVAIETTSEYKPDKIVVGCGMSSEPIVWVDTKDNNTVKGHEADLWNAFSELTGVKVEFLPAEFSSLFGYLDSAKIDTVANQITLNATRLKKYDFVTPYAYMPEKLMVREDCDWKEIKELAGHTVGYQNGSNGKNLFEKIQKDYKIDLKITAYESDVINQALQTGKIDAIIVPGASYAYKINKGILKGRLVEESITYGAKGYAFRKDDEEATRKRAFVEKTFETLRENGTLTKLSKKWYGGDFTFLPEGVKYAN